MNNDVLLNCFLLIIVAIIITKMNKNQTVRLHKGIYFLLEVLFLCFMEMSIPIVMQIICGNFVGEKAHYIWLSYLLGAIIYLPSTGAESKNQRKSTIVIIFSEIEKYVEYAGLGIVAFSAREIFSLSSIVIGFCVIIVSVLLVLLRYYAMNSVRAFDVRDCIGILLISCLYCYLNILVYNTMFKKMISLLPLRVGILFLFFSFLFVITTNLNITIRIGVLIDFVWILIHYYVWQFRGTVFVAGDILNANTAAAVAQNYSYIITEEIWWFAAITCAVILFEKNCRKVCLMPGYLVGKKRVLFSGIGTLSICALIMGWYHTDFIEYMNLPYNEYDHKEVYDRVGPTLGFLEIMKVSEVKEPENYSENIVRELAEKYSSKVEKEETIQPDIIVVMNEAFSDLEDAGTLDVNMDYMPFYHSLETGGNTAVGNVLVSTLGGGTSKSEYEFLTGNSLEFTPSAFPYAEEIRDDVYSIVSTLKEQGYHTVATHPEAATNWKRNTVYPYLQFDDMYFIDDYENPEYIRSRFVSDRDVYKKVLGVLENSQNENPRFIFAVTVQNHGGYSASSLRKGEELSIRLNGQEEAGAIDGYLSLIYESDQAFQEFVQAVEELERPTVIVMFGDHFPRLDDSDWNLFSTIDYEDISSVQKRYATPYIVHANYDVDFSELSEYMSVNYLGANVLNACGLQLSAYDNYLLEMQETIPAMNANGFITDEGVWYKYSDDYPEKYRAKLNEYNVLEYNARFKTALPEMFSIVGE